MRIAVVSHDVALFADRKGQSIFCMTYAFCDPSNPKYCCAWAPGRRGEDLTVPSNWGMFLENMAWYSLSRITLSTRTRKRHQAAYRTCCVLRLAPHHSLHMRWPSGGAIAARRCDRLLAKPLGGTQLRTEHGERRGEGESLVWPKTRVNVPFSPFCWLDTRHLPLRAVSTTNTHAAGF